MPAEAINRLAAWIHARINGGCKIMSMGDSCTCPLCSLDEILEHMRELQQQADKARPPVPRVRESCRQLVDLAGGLRKAASLCGEHPSNFVNISKGKRNISWAKLRKIEEAIASCCSSKTAVGSLLN